MKKIQTKPHLVLAFLAFFLVSAIFVAKAADSSQNQKQEWLKVTKEYFDFKMPKGYDLLVPEGAGGGGEAYVDLSLVPKKSKTQSPKIKMGVYIANYPTMEDYLDWSTEYGDKRLGETTVNGQKWHRFTPAYETFECYGMVKNDKQYQFCLDAGEKPPSSSLKKTFQTFLKSVKIK